MTEASKMVEVGTKEVTAREATAECTIHMTSEACAELVKGTQKGDPLEAVRQGSEPAAVWRYLDGEGQIGVINSVSEPFCASCDRVRLTADGKFRNCLFAVHETDLRSILRGGGSDDDVAAAVAADVGQKWAGHSIGKVNFIRPARSMSQIGG